MLLVTLREISLVNNETREDIARVTRGITDLKKFRGGAENVPKQRLLGMTGSSEEQRPHNDPMSKPVATAFLQGVDQPVCAHDLDWEHPCAVQPARPQKPSPRKNNSRWRGYALAKRVQQMILPIRLGESPYVFHLRVNCPKRMQAREARDDCR